MKILSKLIGSKPAEKDRYWSSDLLEHAGMGLYYSAQEAIHAYLFGFELLKKREIALQVEEALDSFLKYSYSNEEIGFLTELFGHNYNEISKIVNLNQGDAKILKELSPAGFKLLEISDNINIQILRKLYRQAVLKYHPDRGGTHEKMVLVNESFDLFFNALLNSTPLSKINGESFKKLKASPESWDDWLYSVYLILASINGYFFAADKAFVYLKNAHQHALKSTSKYVGYFAQSLFDYMSGGLLCSTCRALARLKMKPELMEAAVITSYFIDRMFESWPSDDIYNPRPERNNLPNEKSILKEWGTKLVLNHPEKAINAYRLGKIDKKRFDKVMGKFNRIKSLEEEMAVKINNFLKINKFIIKLSDANYKINSSNPKVVAFPSLYQQRFDHLSDDQKWEYLRTWGNKGNAELVAKYYEIRTREIMLGLIHNYNSINHTLLEKEISFFCENFGERFNRYLVIADFFQYLKSLNSNIRQKKLLLLRTLDETESPNHTLTLVISINGIGQGQEPKKKINADPDYVEFAKRDLNEIIREQATGYFTKTSKQQWR